jgi:SpoVK/Ycf46/Vps4 family AAA+-type ATPase
VQIHPRKTPLAGDVDFRALAERFTLSGGDIKNAVIKAAAAAAADAGPEVGRRIHQRHFERAVEEVMAAKTVMQQSLFKSNTPDPLVAMQLIEARWRRGVSAALLLGAAALISSLAALIVALMR